MRPIQDVLVSKLWLCTAGARVHQVSLEDSEQHTS